MHQTSLKTSYLPSGGSQDSQRANMTASNTAFTVFSGFGFILSVVPLYWHLESWNVGTCMYMIWTALACLVHFVDSIVWSGNAINWAPVWCDIGTFTHIFACFFIFLHYLTIFTQLFAFKSLSWSPGPRAVSALFAVCTTSLPPPL